MKVHLSKSTLLVMTAFAAIIMVGIYQQTRIVSQEIRISFARDQVNIFSSMVEKSHGAAIEKARECVEYVKGYYPSGTKQIPGSDLDTIVENSRQLAMSLIERDLHLANPKEK